MTQNEMVLAYMKDNGSITPRQAVDELGCMRLGARIWDLKRRGVKINKVMVTSSNRFGNDVRFARYSITDT